MKGWKLTAILPHLIERWAATLKPTPSRRGNASMWMKTSDARSRWNKSSNGWTWKRQQALCVRNTRSSKMHLNKDSLTKDTSSFWSMVKIYSLMKILNSSRLRSIQDCAGWFLRRFGSLNKHKDLIFTKKLNLLSLLNCCKNKSCLRLLTRSIKGYLILNRQCISHGHCRVKWSHRLWNLTNGARLLLFLTMNISKASKELRNSKLIQLRDPCKTHHWCSRSQKLGSKDRQWTGWDKTMFKIYQTWRTLTIHFNFPTLLTIPKQKSPSILWEL